MSAGPTRISTVLPEVLEQHGVQDQVKRMEVLHLWDAIVGEPLSKVTRAKGVEDSTLFVEVRNSAWLMELNMMRGAFLERVNEGLEDVPLERLVFVLAETE